MWSEVDDELGRPELQNAAFFWALVDTGRQRTDKYDGAKPLIPLNTSVIKIYVVKAYAQLNF